MKGFIKPPPRMGPMTAGRLGNCLQATRRPMIQASSVTYTDLLARSKIIDLMPGEAEVLRRKHNR